MLGVKSSLCMLQASNKARSLPPYSKPPAKQWIDTFICACVRAAFRKHQFPAPARSYPWSRLRCKVVGNFNASWEPPLLIDLYTVCCGHECMLNSLQSISMRVSWLCANSFRLFRDLKSTALLTPKYATVLLFWRNVHGRTGKECATHIKQQCCNVLLIIGTI